MIQRLCTKQSAKPCSITLTCYRLDKIAQRGFGSGLLLLPSKCKDALGAVYFFWKCDKISETNKKNETRQLSHTPTNASPHNMKRRLPADADNNKQAVTAFGQVLRDGLLHLNVCGLLFRLRLEHATNTNRLKLKLNSILMDTTFKESKQNHIIIELIIQTCYGITRE